MYPKVLENSSKRSLFGIYSFSRQKTGVESTNGGPKFKIFVEGRSGEFSDTLDLCVERSRKFRPADPSSFFQVNVQSHPSFSINSMKQGW